MSSVTSTWPSHWAEAPMPIIGQRDGRGRPRSAICLHHALRRRSQKAPASATALASATIFFGLGLALAARAIAAEHVDRLRRQADMADHRNAALGEEVDGLRHRLAAFQLDRRAAGLLHAPATRWRTPARASLHSCRTACRPRPARASCRAPPRRRARTSSPASPARSRAGRRSPGRGCRRPAACRNAGRAIAPSASCRRSA